MEPVDLDPVRHDLDRPTERLLRASDERIARRGRRRGGHVAAPVRPERVPGGHAEEQPDERGRGEAGAHRPDVRVEGADDRLAKRPRRQEPGAPDDARGVHVQDVDLPPEVLAREAGEREDRPAVLRVERRRHGGHAHDVDAVDLLDVRGPRRGRAEGRGVDPDPVALPGRAPWRARSSPARPRRGSAGSSR